MCTGGIFVIKLFSFQTSQPSFRFFISRIGIRYTRLLPSGIESGVPALIAPRHKKFVQRAITNLNRRSQQSTIHLDRTINRQMNSASINDAIGTTIEECLSIFFDDETDNTHIFGERSINALQAISSEHNKQHRRASFGCHKPSKASAWHGSCASFRGNSSELLNLSSSWNESNKSCKYLSLQTNDKLLCGTSPRKSSRNEQEIILLDRETIKGKLQEKYGHDSSHRKMARENINPRISLNESRFDSSTLLLSCSDKLPRKPKRENCEDDDGNDAEFTDKRNCESIRINMYDIDKGNINN